MNPQSSPATNANSGNSGQSGSSKTNQAAAPKTAAVDNQSVKSNGRKKSSQPSTKTKPTPPGAQTQSTTSPNHEDSETPFRFDAPSAKEVFLAGEFTDWDKSPIKMIKGGGGVWHTKVNLKQGHYPYRFVVDGEWRDDPHCHHKIPNPFGGYNSVIEIP